MKQYADLHVHTNLSDGSDTVAEVLALAQRNNVSVLSITDHNTVDAYSGGAREAAARAGLRLIPGVELDTIYQGRQYHMLAFGADVQNPRLRQACAHNAGAQEAYNLSLLRHMEADGLGVSEADYHQYAIPLGRGGWKLLNYLLDIGMTKSLLEGTKFYGQYGFHANTIDFLSLEEAVGVAKEAGGIPILAHPAEQIRYDPYAAQNDAFWSALDEVLQSGVEGVECIHPLHEFDLQRDLIALCQARGLFISGGTDYHGHFFNKQKQTVGGQFVAVDLVQRLIDSVP